MPLRFPRPVMALIAAGTAVVSIGVAAGPAHADQVRHREWWLTALGITGAWSASQGSGVTVAVLSDGVDASQPDLASAVTTAPAPSGAPSASGQYFGEQGTAIASLIAGRGHGSHGKSGIVGVAPEARILSVPVTLPADDPDLSETAVAAAIPAAIAAGIRYAVQHGATVIDLPIDPGQPGSTGTGGASAAAGGSTAEQQAIKYAIARDVVLVAPAGDDGTASDAPNYPAAYHGVIAVGAFNSAFIKAPWSSHQSYVTLTAAGVGVLASASTGGYQTVSSTSAASAVVSGIAALIRSRYPHLTAQQVRTSMTSSTVYRRADGLAHGSGYGAVNAAKAMTAAAMLGTPPSARAGAGAQPPLAPAAVAAPSATQGIESQLLRAGELSGGLLVVLLLLIALYAATGRRRRRGGQPAVTAQWAPRQAQSRYPHAGDLVQADDFTRGSFSRAGDSPPGGSFARSGEFARGGNFDRGGDFGRGGDFRHAGDYAQAGAFAEADSFARDTGAEPDRMVEVYTAPVSHYDRGAFGPPASRGVFTGPAGEGLFAPAARPVRALPAGDSGAPGSESADSGPWPTHSPASRAVGRRPAVSGTPPWEPAAAPEEEPSWPGAPGRHSITGRLTPAALPGPAPSGPPSWGDEPTGQSLFEPAHRYAPDPAALEDPSAPTAWSPAGDADGAGGGWQGQAYPSDAGWDDRRWGPGQEAGPAVAADGDLWSSGQHRSGAHDWNGAQDWQGQQDWNGPQDWNGAQDWQGSPNQAGAIGDVQPGWRAENQWQDEPRTAASGLPIRRPGSAMPAPMSPSGSLWEPVERDSDDGSQRDSQDSASRPIYVWDPATRPPAAPRYRLPPSE